MPAYVAGSVVSLAPGDLPYNSFNAEAIAAPEAGQQICLIRPGPVTQIRYGTMQVVFSGAPGSFELDFQESNTDADADYVTIGSITSVDSGNSATFDYQTGALFVLR
jgi:hypothetical protein